VDVNVASLKGYTPIMEATLNGDIETIQKLLDAGADINARTKSGAGIVIVASNGLKQAIALYAIDRGADYTTPDNRGITPLIYAIRNNQYKLVARTIGDTDVNAIANERSGATLLLDTIAQGNVKIVRLMLDKGGDTSRRTNIGSTALHLAASSANPTLVNDMLARGLDVNAVNSRGNTPLFDAISVASMNVVQNLLATGADVNHQNTNGMTPLMLAVNKENPEITRMLLLAGADISLQDNEGDTVFAYALPRRNDAINSLLENARKQASASTP
jgi:ankyrin repeat protein